MANDNIDEKDLWPQTKEEKNRLDYWVEKAIGHSTSSPKTLNSFKMINEDLKEVKKIQIDHSLGLVEVKKDVSYIKMVIDEIKDANKETAEFIKEAPTKYASKSTLDKLIIGVLMSAISALGFVATWCWDILTDK